MLQYRQLGELLPVSGGFNIRWGSFFVTPVLILSVVEGNGMLTVQGYFDGAKVKTLEKLVAKPNQRVVITVMDDFVEPAKKVRKVGMRGVLARYADSDLRNEERGAWEREAVKKYGNI